MKSDLDETLWESFCDLRTHILDLSCKKFGEDYTMDIVDNLKGGLIGLFDLRVQINVSLNKTY